MNILSITGIIASLSLLMYQDFKYREVSVLFIATLLLSIVLFNTSNNVSLSTILANSGINAIVVGLNLVIITLYFSIKNRKPVNITRQQLGWGDIIFLFVTCFLFSPLNFLVFFIGSLLFSLLLILVFFNKPDFKSSVPLVGLQAVALIIVLIFCMLYQIVPANDDTFLKFLA